MKVITGRQAILANQALSRFVTTLREKEDPDTDGLALELEIVADALASKGMIDIEDYAGRA